MTTNEIAGTVALIALVPAMAVYAWLEGAPRVRMWRERRKDRRRRVHPWGK